MWDAFISHETSDDATVNCIDGALRAAGLSTWVDHRNAKPGVNWPAYLRESLDAAA